MPFDRRSDPSRTLSASHLPFCLLSPVLCPLSSTPLSSVLCLLSSALLGLLRLRLLPRGESSLRCATPDRARLRTSPCPACPPTSFRDHPPRGSPRDEAPG